MPHETTSRFKTPRAAAIAGIAFALLLMASLVLVWAGTPASPESEGAWLARDWRKIELAMNLLPFAGMAFLWFMGVLRDRMGVHEDKFFATVFLGSGLLFLAMLFAGAAVAGGIIAIGAAPGQSPESGVYRFGRIVTYETIRVYAMRMAGVFMISAGTLSLRTGMFPRWMAYVGWAAAITLLLALSRAPWALLLFPLWVLLVSVYILVTNFRTKTSDGG